MIRGRKALFAVAALAILVWPLLAAPPSEPSAASLQSGGTTTRVSVAGDTNSPFSMQWDFSSNVSSGDAHKLESAAWLSNDTLTHSSSSVPRIDNIKEFLDTCPTQDPAHAQIRSDLKIRRNGVLVGDIACSEPVSEMPLSEFTHEFIVLQALRVIYYMDLGRSGHLPWTSGTLYQWLESKLGGINISDTASNAFCCQEYDGELYIVIPSLDESYRDLFRQWQGMAVEIALFMHEARHVDGYGHVSCCGIPGGCDQTYDENDLTPYGIQWWLHESWLTGHLYVGFSCLEPDEVNDIANGHLDMANGLRIRFCDTKPPELTMPEVPGGPCLLDVLLRIYVPLVMKNY